LNSTRHGQSHSHHLKTPRRHFWNFNPIRLNVPKPGVIFVTVDPGNPALHSNVDRSLERMFAHEPHHAARWGAGLRFIAVRGAGVGRLAGHFVLELFLRVTRALGAIAGR
jgi:hypothetical protein